MSRLLAVENRIPGNKTSPESVTVQRAGGADFSFDKRGDHVGEFGKRIHLFMRRRMVKPRHQRHKDAIPIGEFLKGDADTQPSGTVNMEKGRAVTADKIAERTGGQRNLDAFELATKIVSDFAHRGSCFCVLFVENTLGRPMAANRSAQKMPENLRDIVLSGPNGRTIQRFTFEIGGVQIFRRTYHHRLPGGEP